jgi:ankyrin repeat protein
MKGRTDVINMLAKAGAAVDAKERKYGRTPLIDAAWYGHPEALKALIDCGANVEAEDDALGRTALATAADKAADPKLNNLGEDVGTGKGHRECVKILLAAGADPNAVDQAGKAALHWAASQGNGECCQMLLDAGAVIDIRDSLFQRTPLHYAAQNAQPRSWDALTARGANQTLQDVRGNTPVECTRSIMLQGALKGSPASMLDPSIPVPSWDEIHGTPSDTVLMA